MTTQTSVLAVAKDLTRLLEREDHSNHSNVSSVNIPYAKSVRGFKMAKSCVLSASGKSKELMLKVHVDGCVVVCSTFSLD